MGGKVTDPALLAALDGPGQKVADPETLKTLDAPQMSGGAKALNMIGRGAFALPGVVGLDFETVVAAQMALTDPSHLGGSISDRFAAYKGSLLKQSEQTDKENPIASGVVRGLAAAPGEALAWGAAPQLKLAQGAGFLEKALAYGPRLGLLSGASEYGGTAHKDPGARALGAASAGAGAAVLGGTMAGALPNPNVLAPIASTLDEKAMDQGRKALTGIGTPLSARKPLSDDAVRAALDVGAIRPGRSVVGAHKVLETAADDQGQRYAAILAELEAQGVHGPYAQQLANDLSARSSQAFQNSLNSPRPGMLQSTADELGQKALPVTGKGRLGLMQSEEMKRTLQDEARREYDKVTRQYTATGQTKKEIAAMVREAIEQAVDQQSALAPDAAAAFMPVKTRLSHTLEALNAAEEGAGRAARRKTGSLTGTIVGSAVGAAHGAPAGLGAAVAHDVISPRLSSTLSWGANKGAQLLRASDQTPTSVTPLAQSYPDLLDFLRLQLAGADDEERR